MSEEPSSRLQKTLYWFVAAVIIIPIIWASVTIVQTRDMILADLETLNTRREAAFTELRPALLRYREDHGSFPGTLEKLLPDYIPAIPEILLYRAADKTKYNSINLVVTYEQNDAGATFSFQRGYDHTPVVTYDVLSDRYSDRTDAVTPDIPNE
ncbi:MAG: hypothetical protein OEY43_04365 [Gammaproteobacteria bacterium]|nr:hypothetical protein [Gammaproteobacteria bacterium]